jgi:integrase
MTETDSLDRERKASLATSRVFGKAGVIRKSPSTEDVGAGPLCPSCGSFKTWRDGFRWNNEKTVKVQRYLCRDCGFRFSATENSAKLLKAVAALPSERQICAFIAATQSSEAKNLESAQRKVCAEDASLNAHTQGALTQFYSYLEKNAYSEGSNYPKKIKRLAKLGVNLFDQEAVKEAISKLTFKDKNGETAKAKNGTKNFYCCAYAAFAKMLKIPFENPGYQQEDKEVYVPYETELDALIAATQSRRMACYLQTLKETYADPGEALRIRWIDIDEKNMTITINFPVKGHLAGTLSVSAKLLSMLSALPHDNEKVFPCTYHSVQTAFVKLRKRVARIQQNPRIIAVELRGYRHWAGTKIAYETNGNHLEVKRLLRHKCVESTMKYIGKIDFKTEDFDTTSATSLEDILRLGSSGWTEYSIAHINGQEIHCFKKPKRFQSNV